MDDSVLSLAEFTDLDDYSNSIEGAELEMRLLHVHHRLWSIHTLTLDSLQLQCGFEGSGFLTRGTMSAGGWGFYILRSERPVPVNGQLLSQGSVVLMPPRAEFFFAGEGLVEWSSLFVPTHLIDPELESIRSLTSLRIVDAINRSAAGLRSVVDLAFRYGQAFPGVQASKTAAAMLEDDLLSAAIAILGDTNNGIVPAPPASSSRNQLVHDAIEFIQDTPEGALTVAMLAKSIGTSERTLLHAFRDRLGVTPQAYLINHRLHKARRHLRASASSGTVASVAEEYQFSDFGRFASRYHELFGELPSVTLRRRH